MFCWTNVYLLCNMMFSGFLVAWFISEACEKCMRASPKTIYEKIGKKKKNKNFCAEGVWSVTLSFAFTKQLVFEYFYPSFMYVAG